MAKLFAQFVDLLGWTTHGGYNDRIALYRQPVLIYNPVAGKIRRNPERILQRTTAALERANIRPELLPSRAPGDASVLAAKAAADGADLVMVLGGDGTINEVVNGLAGSNVPMAVLPGGTANCLAVELGLGLDVAHASSELQGFVPRPVALGRITVGDSPSRYFLLMCGAGLDARIVYDVSGDIKRAVGKLAYWISGLSRIPFRVENFDVSIGGEVIRCGFMLASRIRNYGGDLEIARGASLSQDHFEVVLFEGSVPLRYAWYMLGVATKRVQQMRGVRVMRAQRVDVLTEAHLQIDGEHVGYAPATIEIVPASLHLLLPPAYG